MTACTCPPGELAATDCPEHGLYGDRSYPPMGRHARDGETHAEAQRRLYLASAADRIRVEAAGFRWPLRPCPPRELGQR